MTDQEMLSDVQLMVLEPRDNGATWPSGLWTAAEVLAYLNQRQHRFLKETAMVTATGYVSFAIGQQQAALPTDWIATIRCTWRNGTTLVYSPMYDGDSQEADWGRPLWAGTQGTPLTWTDAEDPPPQLRITPMPDVAGRVEMVYVALADICDGTGVPLTVPEAFLPHLRYGILADMFWKQGRAFDPVRAAYAESRYAEGIEVGRRFVNGLVGEPA
jgi:hypothetical protein